MISFPTRVSHQSLTGESRFALLPEEQETPQLIDVVAQMNESGSFICSMACWDDLLAVDDEDDNEDEDDDDHGAEDDDDHENDDTATGAEARKIGCLQQSALGNSCGSGPISSIS